MAAKVVNIMVISLVALMASTAKATDYDVTKYGGKADQKTDLSKALLAAWKEACAATTESNVVIPKGSYYLNEVLLEGPCKAPIKLILSGTLLANPDAKSFKSMGWITIRRVNKFTLHGGGIIDGQGAKSWDENQCSKNGDKCPPNPLNLWLHFLNNSVIKDITSRNSKGFHMSVVSCTNTAISRISSIAPETAHNTDGIHIGRCNGLSIKDSTFKTGDDCISIGDDVKNITIKGVTCGPGHGISVGSLGKYKNEGPVEGLHISNCTLTGTMNGVRIKSWPDREAGEVNNVTFENIIMNNVGYPIIIDQQYCPWTKCNKQKASLVKIGKVTFKNIHGTSSTQNVISLACNPPCQDVEVSDVNLSYSGRLGSAISTCSNVKPKSSGKVVPALCGSKATTQTLID